MLSDQLLALVRRAVQDAISESRQVSFGVVTVTSPLTVRFNGDTAGTPVALKLDAYTPTLSDEVALVRAGKDWLCLGDYS